MGAFTGEWVVPVAGRGVGAEMGPRMHGGGGEGGQYMLEIRERKHNTTVFKQIPPPLPNPQNMAKV